MTMHLVKPHSSPATMPAARGRSGPSRASDAPDVVAQHRLVRLARMIEPDDARISEWRRHTPIAEFGGLTADALVSHGMQYLVEKFLLAILSGERG
ncbi:hypothetical protein [Dyella japonica]|uniref:Antitoxin Xre/MbcA/ParS-like toxin-binding domain-containing protein n=1 Tax=Dyella japonica TaxID=231455 RepID=A0ABV2K0I4_9GAMM